MERWLGKPLAVLGLCAVLFMAALNRQDPMVYAMFWVMTTIGVLAYALPWLSLRGLRVEFTRQEAHPVRRVEGEPVDVGLRIEQAGWFPAWMVEVVARWHWSGRTFESRVALPMLLRGAQHAVLDRVEFSCRGQYRLVSLHLQTGFPLGLIEARRTLHLRSREVLVQPAPASVDLPERWSAVADLLGDLVRGHRGESLELNQLRRHEFGEALRHVDWRASARVGDLIVRQFQHPACRFAQVVVAGPAADTVGLPDAPAEHAIRVAAGVCLELASQQVRFDLRLADGTSACDPEQASLRLAALQPGGLAWEVSLASAADRLRRGEHLVAVVPVGAAPGPLAAAALVADARGGCLVVVVATWVAAPRGVREQAAHLLATLHTKQVACEVACR